MEVRLDAKTRAQFEAALPGVLSTVLARAALFVTRNPWFARRYASVKEAAEELAQDAVVRTMTGKRTWNPAKVPDLNYFLVGVMRSIISAARKSPVFMTESLSTLPLGEEEDGVAADRASGTLDDRDRGFSDPERVLVDAERYSALVYRALDAAGDDGNANKIVEAVVAGCAGVAEIVEATGLTKEQVYAATRKIRDRVRKGANR